MSKEEIVRDEETPDWNWDNEEVVEVDMIPHFSQGMADIMLSFAKYMWLIGHAAHGLQQRATYGDNAIKKLASGIHRGDSWVYECIKMYEAYSWEHIQSKLLMAGIPASSIQRLGCIKDEGARAYVEDKLVSGDITYEEITKAKKDYETVVDNPDVSPSDVGDGAEQTIAERNASANLGDDDPNNVAAASIRSFCGSKARVCQELKRELENKTYEKVDQLDMISDESLYGLSEQRLAELAEAARDLSTVLINIAESIELKTGAAAEEE